MEPIRALKNIAELMTGQRAGAPVPMARVFKTDVKPGAANSPVNVGDLRDCDLWIDRGNADKLNYWDESVKAWRPTT